MTTEELRDTEEQRAPSSSSAEQPGLLGYLKYHSVTLIVIAGITALLVIGLQYDFGTLLDPGPAFWPTVVSSATLLLCLTLLLPGSRRGDEPRLTAEQWRSLVLAVLPLLVFTPLLTFLGTIPTCALLAFYWLKVPHQRAFWYSVRWSLILTAGIYLIFILGLRVSLPMGAIFGGTI